MTVCDLVQSGDRRSHSTRILDAEKLLRVAFENIPRFAMFEPVTSTSVFALVTFNARR